jgi:hypothetical protein
MDRGGFDMQRVLLPVLLVGALLASSARGAIITFGFDGKITQINNPGGNLPAGIAVNSPFSVQASFDPTTPDQAPSSINGIYATISPLTILVGPLNLVSPNQRNISIDNYTPGLGSDRYRLSDYAFTSASLRVLEFSIELNDPSGYAFTSDHLPVVPPSANQFSSRTFWLQARPADTNESYFTLMGTIDSITTVTTPEPTSLMLLATGGVLMLRRRKRALALGLTPLFLFAVTAELSADPEPSGPPAYHQPT